MPQCMFLASCLDGRPGKEQQVYGVGHVTDFDESDHDFLIQAHGQGKVAYLATEAEPDPPTAMLA